MPGCKIGHAICALPLEPFLNAKGVSPRALWVTRDWKPALHVVFPLRDFAIARTSVLRLSDAL
eukprot:4277575-Amphidinium_carterae.2